MASTLPPLMILDQDKPKSEWVRFVPFDRKKDNVGDKLGVRIGLLPARREIAKTYELYCDDEGFYKQDTYKGVNQLSNPFIDEFNLISMSFGGPLGPVAVLSTRGGLNRKKLIEVFRAQDRLERDEHEGPGEYETIILEALEAHDAK